MSVGVSTCRGKRQIAGRRPMLTLTVPTRHDRHNGDEAGKVAALSANRVHHGNYAMAASVRKQ